MAKAKPTASLAWLGELITVQQGICAPDGMGGTLREWQDKILTWAHVNQAGVDRHRVHVRRGVCLPSPFRILWHGVAHRIEGSVTTRPGAAYQVFTMIAEGPHGDA